MVGHVNLEEQVDADFSRARRRATLRRAGTRLRSDKASDGLPCLGGVRELPGAAGRVYRGTRTVPVVPTPPRTDEKPNGRTSTKKPSDREQPMMRESGSIHNREERIQVRWGCPRTRHR